MVETARELFRLCLQGVASKQPRTVVPRFRVLYTTVVMADGGDLKMR